MVIAHVVKHKLPGAFARDWVCGLAVFRELINEKEQELIIEKCTRHGLEVA